MMKYLIAILAFILLNCCGSLHEDDNLEGTFSGCSFMTDVDKSYTFNSDGTYSHFRDDRYGDGVTSEIGKWSISNRILTLEIAKFKKNSNEFRDTLNWQQAFAFKYSNGGDCFVLGSDDNYCKGGSCFR